MGMHIASTRIYGTQIHNPPRAPLSRNLKKLTPEQQLGMQARERNAHSSACNIQAPFPGELLFLIPHFCFLPFIFPQLANDTTATIALPVGASAICYEG